MSVVNRLPSASKSLNSHICMTYSVDTEQDPTEFLHILRQKYAGLILYESAISLKHSKTKLNVLTCNEVLNNIELY